MRVFYYLLIAGGLIAGCASELQRHDKGSYRSDGRKVDLSAMMFESWENGQEVSVADYMVANKLNFLLLMFGSVGCTKCNEKALELSQDYLGKHKLLLAGSVENFQLVGVNTDSGGARAKFNRIMLSQEQRSAYGYGFVKWSDPAGRELTESILAENEDFGVPYTALISKKGDEEWVEWSFNNQQPYTIEFLLKKSAATIAGRKLEQDDSKAKPKPTPKVPEVVYDLAFESPLRFDSVDLVDCLTGSAASLADQVKTSDITFIQVSKSGCDASSHCYDNMQRLKSLSGSCTGRDSCGSVTLSLSGPAKAACKVGGVFTGGQEFFDKFETHFNWKYDPYIDEFGEPLSIKEVEGPLTFAFRKDGKMVYSNEGLLPNASRSDSLETVLKNGANDRAAIVDFPVYGERSHGSNAESFGLSSILRQSKYTVVAGFGQFCSGCIDELEHWSHDGELADYCAKSDGFCQVFALEERLARPHNPSGRTRVFNDIKNRFFNPRGVKVPLLLEEEAFSDMFGRIYQSYLSLYFTEWKSYGTVLYDREGKVLYDFPGGRIYKPDPVLKTLKTLKEKS